MDRAQMTNNGGSESIEFFTTNDIAGMLRVTRVTVRNWIVRGRINATKTPGGHRRVSRKELISFLEKNNYPADIVRDFELTYKKKFVYCWEFQHRDLVQLELMNRCSECIAFLSRAQRCHVLRLHVGHKQIFCPTTCEDCDYYNTYFKQN